MLRTTVSRIKKAWAFALASRGRGDVRSFTGKFHKSCVSVLRRAAKSTKSGDDEKLQCEKCKELIDYVFGKNMTYRDIKQLENKLYVKKESRDNTAKLIPEKVCEGSNIDKGRIQESSITIPINNSLLQATTAKQTEEQLMQKGKQKLENIEETPLVEAEKKNVEGFNTPLRVIDRISKMSVDDNEHQNQINKLLKASIVKKYGVTKNKNNFPIRKDITKGHLLERDVLHQKHKHKIPSVNFATDDSSQHRKSRGSSDINPFDAIAKRYLDTPTKNIDEHLIKEMKKLGVPHARTNETNSELEKQVFQIGVSKKPRRPVEKTELELEIRKHERDKPCAINSAYKEQGSNNIMNKRITTVLTSQTSNEAKVEDVKPKFDPYKPIIDPYDKKTIAFDTEYYGYGPLEKLTYIVASKQKTQSKTFLRNVTAKVTVPEKSGLVTSKHTRHPDTREHIMRNVHHDEVGWYDQKYIYPDDDSDLPLKSEEQSEQDSNSINKTANVASKNKLKYPNSYEQCSQRWTQKNLHFNERIHEQCRETMVSEHSPEKHIETERRHLANQLSNTLDKPETISTYADKVPNNYTKPYYMNKPYYQYKTTTERNEKYSVNDTSQNLVEPEIYYDGTDPPENVKRDMKSNAEQQHAAAYWSVPNIKEKSNETIQADYKIFKERISHGFEETKSKPEHLTNSVPADKVKRQDSVSNEALPSLNPKGEDLSLSEMLRRVRMRNRIENCKSKKKLVDPVEGKCGDKKPPCPPRAPVCTPCPPPACPPKPPPCPKPCRQKCPPACPPTTPACPPPAPTCQPPCTKYMSTYAGMCFRNFNIFALLFTFYPGNQRKISSISIIDWDMLKQTVDFSSKAIVTEEVISRIQNLGYDLISTYGSRTENLVAFSGNLETVIFARDFEPWVPIPSWPIPVKEEKRPFICPKKGCPIVPPPRYDAPCHKGCDKNQPPCTGFPKRRNFSLADILLHFAHHQVIIVRS